MSRLRVAFPFIGVEVAGAVMSAADNISRLREDGRVEPVVILPRQGPATAVFQDVGVEVMYHGEAVDGKTSLRGPTSSFRGKLRALPIYYRTWRFASEFLGSGVFEVVHINEDRNVLPWGLAAARHGIPLVWHVRQERPKPWLDWIRVRLADQMIFVSDANIGVRFGSGGTLPPHLTIYNAVDLETFHPPSNQAALRAELGLDPDLPLLLFVGNLFPRKRPDWVLRATAELQMRLPMQTVLIGAPLGDKAYIDQLKRLAASAPSPQHVRVLGSKRDVQRYFAASDLVTLPSVLQGEAFPRVVIEAMATGVPVVATRVAGIPEAIEHGVTGLLVEPDDYPGFVEAIATLLTDPAQRVEMSSRAQSVAAERFSGATVVDKLVSIYTRLQGGFQH